MLPKSREYISQVEILPFECNSMVDQNISNITHVKVTYNICSICLCKLKS